MAGVFNGKLFLDELTEIPDEWIGFKDERKKEIPLSRIYVGERSAEKGKQGTKGK
jgi:hypothetical protein